VSERSVDREDNELVQQIREARPDARVGDFGCGQHKLHGAVGVDAIGHAGIVDLVCDFNRIPWPFEESSFDIIRCNHLVEHVDDIVRFFEEVHRILTPGGYLIVRTPHYSNLDSFVDPTHKRHLTTGSLDYFIRGTDKFGLYSTAPFCCEERRLQFGSGLRSTVGKWLCRLSVRRFEKYHCKLFPAKTLYFRLRTIKDGWTPTTDAPARLVVV
jgi:SAM-dependent methyltransferase